MFAMITVTSLTHPTMIAKIRKGITCAAKGKGDEMGGHGSRVYIQNSKGHNIMRIDWKGNGKFVAYGGADWGRTEVTDIVKEALQRGCSANRVKPRDLEGKRPQTRLYNLMGIVAIALMLLGSNDMAYADKPPTALESACIKQPELLVCTWAFGVDTTLKNVRR
jgi:hypothetical protein